MNPMRQHLILSRSAGTRISIFGDTRSDSVMVKRIHVGLKVALIAYGKLNENGYK
jgi:hypothetical protein